MTSTVGFKAAVYGAAEQRAGRYRGVDPPRRGATVGERQRFRLDTGPRRYRYYLVWISELPDGTGKAEIQELSLKR